MKRELLLAGPIVMILIAIFIVILSSITSNERSLVQNQQEMPKESNETFVRRVPTVSSSQPKQESANSEPSEEEWEEFEALLRSLEELEGEIEDIQPEGFSETQLSETECIKAEKEELFIGVKQLIDRLEAIRREEEPFVTEHGKLKYRQIGIGMNDLVGASREKTKRLHEEFQRNEERMETLRAIIISFEEQKRQLKSEFEQKYGMTYREFSERYREEYRSWKAGL